MGCWVGGIQQGSNGSATLVLPFSSPTKPQLVFFQHFAQITGGRSPRAMEGRAGLCEELCAACSGALPNTWRLMLSLSVG